jgi:hypothetical protein
VAAQVIEDERVVRVERLQLVLLDEAAIRRKERP